MKFIKQATVLSISALILIGFGCGKKDDGAANPNPAPVAPAPSPNGTVGNCPQLTGGTVLSSIPFEGRLSTTQTWNYNWANQPSTLLLSPSITSQVGYTFQNNNIIASGSIRLAELSRYYQDGTIPTACVASPSGAQSNRTTGYFYNGQVSSLTLTGSLSIPYYSPFSWQGYPTGAPGTNQTLGQQLIQVIVGSTCATSFVPSYGNNPGRIRGCISVRLGNQPNSQVINYQSQ